MSKTLMIQGTASDVGKSVITTGLCRIFTEDGYRTAPFKSQNMSLNSYVTPDGKEIGRAQAVQAEACRISAATDMNPILLKPTGERRSQVVVHGKPLRDYDAAEYREQYLPEAERIVRDALDRLRSAHDIVVLEGAGSPAEVNLRDRDIVNMRAAAWADAPVILVADIDRGGVFASILGTMMILTPEERDRVKGFIINKFRGDPALLTSGLQWLEEQTGKPVLGVVPMLPNLGLEDEDSASLATRNYRGSGELDIAVVHLPRMSNFSDFDSIQAEPDASIRYITKPGQLGRPDALILPGTKNTLLDLEALRASGLEQEILSYDGPIVGICGGYQMLGLTLQDPDGFESSESLQRTMDGLGLLPMDTAYAGEKRTQLVAGSFTGWDGNRDHQSTRIEGYEIHMGITSFREPVRHLFQLDSGAPEGAASENAKVWGTYIHGIFDNDVFRRSWLNRLRTAKGLEPLPVSYRHRESREASFDRLAEHVRRNVNMEAIYDIVGLKMEAKS